MQGDTKFQDSNSNYLRQSTIIDGPGGLALDIIGVNVCQFFSRYLIKARFGAVGGMRTACVVSVGIYSGMLGGKVRTLIRH